jgi:hypothetical protein
MAVKCQQGNFKGRDLLEHLAIHVKIILKWASEKYGVKV